MSTLDITKQTIINGQRVDTPSQMWRPIRTLTPVDTTQDQINKLQQKVQPPAKGGSIKISVGNPKNLLSIFVTEGPVKIQGGTMSLVSVTFTLPPDRSTYESTRIWIKGYKGNPNPVLETAGASGPINFLLETTNESITIIGQPVSQDGSVIPLDQCLTATVLLDGVTSAPPTPSIAQTLVTIPLGYQFAFNQVNLGAAVDAIASYTVYRSTSNSIGTAGPVRSIPHNPNNAGQAVVVQDTTGDGVTYYYWVTAVNTRGLESLPANAQSGGITAGTPFTTLQTTSALATGAIGQNALDNPGFDIPAIAGSGDLFAGWKVTRNDSNDWTLQSDSSSFSGATCLLTRFGTSKTVVNGTSAVGAINMSRTLPVIPGQRFKLAAKMWWGNITALPAGVSGNTYIVAQVNYSDSSFDQFYTNITSGDTAFAWLDKSVTFTVPTPVGKTVTNMIVFVQPTLTNLSGGSFTSHASNPQFDARVDNVSLIRIADLDTEVADGPNYARVLGNVLQAGRVKGQTYGMQMVANPGFELNLTGSSPPVRGPLGTRVADDWTIAANDGLWFSPSVEGPGSGQAFDGGSNLVMPIYDGGVGNQLILANNTSAGCAIAATAVAVKPGQIVFYGGMIAIGMNAFVPTGMFVTARFQIQYYDALGNAIPFQQPGDSTHSPYHDAIQVAGGGGAVGYTLRSYTDVVPNGAAYGVLEVVNVVTNLSGGSYTFTRSGSTVWSDTRFDDVFMFIQIDPTDPTMAMKGSMPPVITGKLGYTQTPATSGANGAITLWWDGSNNSEVIVIYRADGTTTSVPTGSTAITGLNAATYYVYPYWDEIYRTPGTGVLAPRLFFVSNISTPLVGGGFGTNATYGSCLFTVQTNQLGQALNNQGHVPLSSGGVPCTVLTVSGGGGGVGGSGRCVIKGTKVRALRDKPFSEVINAEDVVVGDLLWGPNGWEEVYMAEVLPWETFLRFHLSHGDSIAVTPNHVFTMPDGSDRRADAITMNDFMSTEYQLATIRMIEVVEAEYKVAITCGPTHLFYAGDEEPTIVAHNVVLGC